IWVIALIVFPYLGIFAYMITQSRGIAERSSQQAQQARDELRRVAGFSVADEIEKLDRLKKSGSITDQEFTRLRAKLVAEQPSRTSSLNPPASRCSRRSTCGCRLSTTGRRGRRSARSRCARGNACRRAWLRSWLRQCAP